MPATITSQDHPAREAARRSSLLWDEPICRGEALARGKAQMDEETMGVRDEIGFLTIHQRYADRFFPGTSVLYSLAWFARHTERRGALAAGYD